MRFLFLRYSRGKHDLSEDSSISGEDEYFFAPLLIYHNQVTLNQSFYKFIIVTVFDALN